MREQLGAGAGELAHLLPELRELFDDLPEPPAETEGARFRLFDAAARFLTNAASATPIVLVLDDLHAADEPSLLLLRFVAGVLGDAPILVVGTYRDVDPTIRDALASALAELGRERVTRRIELSGLRERDVERYIASTSGTSPSAELVGAIHAETEGNPLFLGEVIRLLAAEGSLADADASALPTLGVPQGVREVIGRRLRRLSDECGRVLTLASVLGRDFRIDALERLSDVGADRLLDVLDEAVAERVLTAASGVRGRLRFAHALIRETLYDELTAPRRMQLHRRAGEALEQLYEQDREPHLAELAYHFLEAAPAGCLHKALDYSRRAGERAVAGLAYEEGARVFGLALQALDSTHRDDARIRCELLLERADALAKAGNMPEAKEAFLAAASLARTCRLSEHMARAALGYGGRQPVARAGRDAHLVPLLEEGLSALGEERSVLRARLLARLAAALRDQPSLEPRSSLSAQAVDIARQLDDKATLAYGLISHFAATWSPDPTPLLEITDEVARLAEELADAELAFQASVMDSIVSLTLGEPDRVAASMRRHSALADVLKRPAMRWWSLAMHSVWTLLRGDFATGMQLVEDAFRLGRRAQGWDAGFAYRIAMFVLRREQGRLAEIEQLIRESIEEYPGYRSFRCLVPLIDCELGRPDEARRRFDDLAAGDFSSLPADGEWLLCLSVLSELAAQLEDAERAIVLYHQLLPHERLFALASGEASVGCVARYLGIVAGVTRQWDDAARHFEHALSAHARMDARPWLAHTQHDYARMLLARDAPGDLDEAQSFLSRALSTYEQLGMPVAMAKASALYRAVTAPWPILNLARAGSTA